LETPMLDTIGNSNAKILLETPMLDTIGNSNAKILLETPMLRYCCKFQC
jgi:hypothetical protein